MERRYLVATLALIATFAVFSHGLRTLEHFSLSYGQHAGANLKAKCNLDASAARFISKVRAYLSPDYPDEAQLMADLNLPIAMAQAKAAEELARQNMAAAQCARATALREAERARRDADRATRLRDRMARTNASAMSISWGANMAAEVNQQVQARTAALAQRIAEQSAQIAARQVRETSLQASDFDMTSAYNADIDSDSYAYSYSNANSNAASSKARCSWTQSQQSAQAARARARAIVHEVQQSFGYR